MDNKFAVSYAMIVWSRLEQRAYKIFPVLYGSGSVESFKAGESGVCEACQMDCAGLWEDEMAWFMVPISAVPSTQLNKKIILYSLIPSENKKHYYFVMESRRQWGLATVVGAFLTIPCNFTQYGIQV